MRKALRKPRAVILKMDPAPGFHAPMHPMAGTGGRSGRCRAAAGSLCGVPASPACSKNLGLTNLSESCNLLKKQTAQIRGQGKSSPGALQRAAGCCEAARRGGRHWPSSISAETGLRFRRERVSSPLPERRDSRGGAVPIPGAGSFLPMRVVPRKFGLSSLQVRRDGGFFCCLCRL